MRKLTILFVSVIVLTNVLKLTAQTQTADSTVNQVILNYFKVKNALVASDGKSTQANAKSLYQAISSIPAGEMASDQRKIWEAYTGKLQNDSKHISESTTLDQQREYFAALSKNLFQVVKTLKVNNKPVYQQYCPMKNATWLSENSEIRNPYYGKQELSCGSVVQTLAPATK